MKKRIRLSLLAILIVLIFPIQMAHAQVPEEPEGPDSWTPVASGIEYQKFHLNDPRPIDVFVARMDRANPSVTIESSIAQGRLRGGGVDTLETVKDMNSRYNQAINYWGKSWGGRNQVVVGINGYFFEQEEDPLGVPTSGQIHSGWYSKRFDETVGDAGFAWTQNREAIMGSCVYHTPSKNAISFENAGSYIARIRGVNVARNEEELILYTSQYDASTRTESDGDTPTLEILVEMERPAGILPSPNGAGGIIRDINIEKGDTLLRFGYVVISAWGTMGDLMKNRVDSDQINVGDQVNIFQEISTCGEGPTIDWTNAYAAIGGNRHYLRNEDDGELNTGFPEEHVPNSYTAIAYNDDYVFFIVADKKNPGVSEGISLYELAVFTRDRLGAKDAVTLDGGGSSTMVVNNELKNNTHCNFRPTDCEDGHIDEPFVEPLVANGMMMVVNLPKDQSTTFVPGDEVIISSSTQVRLGPGTNYPSLGSVPALTDGEILDTLSQTHGVLAKGSYWWLVDFNGYEAGWVREEAIFGGQTPTIYEAFMPVVVRSSQVTAQGSTIPLLAQPGSESRDAQIQDDSSLLRSY